MSGQQADAEAQAEAAREALAKVEENLKAAHEQLTVKQERLSVLEGESACMRMGWPHMVHASLLAWLPGP